MTDEPTPPSGGTSGRTRAALLDAAAAVWAKDFTATLQDVATAAHLSRSTVHRHFDDRQSLIDALLTDSVDRLTVAQDAAIGRCSTAGESVVAVLRALVDSGDRVIFLFADPHRFEGNPLWNDVDDPRFRELLSRAQGEGALSAEVPVRWIEETLYSLVYIAAMSIRDGDLTRHAAGDLAVRTLLDGLGEPQSRMATNRSRQ